MKGWRNYESLKVLLTKWRDNVSTKDVTRILKNANASVEMEGLKPSKFALELAREHLEGKISKNDVTRKIIERYLK